jgi:ATP-dependent DNA helicase RecG
VGSGKTAVAALAACPALESGSQVALMAPTEILAEQHLANFSRWFSALNIPVIALLGKQGVKARREAALQMQNDGPLMVIGTHALFQDDIIFRQLALAIIDEQHRFGVHQRLALKQKGEAAGFIPHQLIMTATPIPRTLAMSAYGDLDTSVIDELPPGRTPIQTLVIPNERRADIVARIEAQCREGRQAYWVCTLIEESDVLQAQAAEATYTELQAALPHLAIGLVHGRQKPAEKLAVMNAFKQGQLQLLIATTVIEVGVDVPNASLMVIENPERLGLAQLHQLRGRVGRGATQSFCVLLYQSPLGQMGKERLSTMRETTDGFRIAEKDLELRGPGEVLGTRQTGLMQFRIADLLRDADLLPQVLQCAHQLLMENPQAAEKLLQRWVAQREHYAHV